MSVSIYVMARKRVSLDERELLKATETLALNGIEIPDDLQKAATKIMGYEVEFWEELGLNYDKLMEVPVRGEGDVMYGDGLVLKLEELPPGTVELRIYAQA